MEASEARNAAPSSPPVAQAAGSPDPVRRSGARAAQLALVVGVGVVAYANALGGPWQFDDHAFVVANPFVRDPGPLLDPVGLWRQGGAAFQAMSRAVTLLTLAANRSANGFDPFGYHLVNVAVHLATALLVYALVVLLFRAPRLASSALAPRAGWVAAAAALLFVAHPLQTQAVTYVSQRAASLATLLGLAGIVAYLRWRLAAPGDGPARRAVLYGAGLAATIAAMLTKEIAFTFPVLLLAAELAFLDGPLRRRLVALAPYLATLAIVPGVVLVGPPAAERLSIGGAAGLAQAKLGHWDYLLTELHVVATYLRLLVFPAGQRVFWEFPIHHSLAERAVLLSALLHGAIVAAAIWAFFASRRRDPGLRLVAFGILWFYVALSVESGLVVIVDVIFEHRVYYPMVGAALAIATAGALAVEIAARSWPGARRAGAIGAACAITALAVATHVRNRAWSSEVALWTDNAEKEPIAPVLWMLGGAAMREGRRELAIDAFRRAIDANPYYTMAYRDLGAAYAATHPARAQHAFAMLRYLGMQYGPALAHWDAAVAMAPADGGLHYGRALALAGLGREREALEEIAIACGLGCPQACRANAGGRRELPPP